MHDFQPDNVQHINVKIFACEPAPAGLDPAILVFHRWIQDGVCPELLIDVADYRHVPEGPGVILIGHEANYSLDCSGGRLGLLYNRKTVIEGGFETKLGLALDRVLEAARRLEQEPEFQNSLAFDPGSLEIIFNDRLLAPNTEPFWQSIRPRLKSFFEQRWGGAAFSLDRPGEPRERLRVSLRKS